MIYRRLALGTYLGLVIGFALSFGTYAPGHTIGAGDVLGASFWVTMVAGLAYLAGWERGADKS